MFRIFSTFSLTSKTLIANNIAQFTTTLFRSSLIYLYITVNKGKLKYGKGLNQQTAAWKYSENTCGSTHLEGEAESALFPVVPLLGHLQQLSLKATPLQLVQLVVTLDHAEKRPIEIEQEHQVKKNVWSMFKPRDICGSGLIQWLWNVLEDIFFRKKRKHKLL